MKFYVTPYHTSASHFNVGIWFFRPLSGEIEIGFFKWAIVFGWSRRKEINL